MVKRLSKGAQTVVKVLQSFLPAADDSSVRSLHSYSG